MKTYLLIFLSTALLLGSCADWLDVKPQDTITEDELFAAGNGYRNALNGVYKQISGTSMYGKEMTWGLLDVMGWLYAPSGFKTYTEYYKVMTSYNYTDQKVKMLISPIWSDAYNAIANCNNLLSRIGQEDTTAFRGRKAEKDLITGEALALRAFLHFDLLRLFAPAPVTKDETPSIPYFNRYPSTYEPYRPTSEILQLIEQDLLEARKLVASYDTTAYRFMLGTAYRIEDGHGDSRAPKDLFFQRRGYRLNYLAITALLARVYNYMGAIRESYYEKSYQMAEEVIGFDTEPDDPYEGEISFTDYWNAEENRKLYDGVLFCLSDNKLLDNYKNAGNNQTILFYLNEPATMFDDDADIRKTELTEAKGSRRLCIKNVESGEYAPDCKDMIPLIRLSELYFIQAEYLCRQKKLSEAIDKLDVVREARNCQTGPLGQIEIKVKDFDTFCQELLREAAREFMQEGQLFFYHKRLNRFPNPTMKAADFVVPKPDNEMIH